MTTYCGDGIVDTQHEACDDGDTDFGDGCNQLCEVSVGWTCDEQEPSHCTIGGMVTLTAGTFKMGSPITEEGRNGDEIEHDVILTRDFAISSIELTQEEFENLMHYNPSLRPRGCAQCPVERVSWYDAVAYLNELTLQHGGTPCYVLSDVVCADQTEVGSSYMDCMNDTAGGILSATTVLNNVDSIYDCAGFRLPTEAEWEYAVRAGETRGTYNGDPIEVSCTMPNDVLGSIAWFCGNAAGVTQAVGGRIPNDWGLYDMLGTSWEWCNDWYGGYPADLVIDPEGPSTGSLHVHRGGSCSHYARCARSASRGCNGWPIREEGFRPAISLP